MHIHNPTNEKMTEMYGGVPFVFPPESTTPVDNKAAANHIINTMGARGLVLLEYGDDTKQQDGKTVKEIKAAAGIVANKAFKRDQVIAHNQDNEERKQTMRPYVKPTTQIIRYAEEFGIKLLRPYEADDLQAQEMNRIRLENDNMKDMVRTQGKQITELLEAIKGGGLQAPPPKSPEEIKDDDAAKELQAKIDKVNSFKRKDYFEKWLKDSKAVIALWPEEAKTVLRKKYTAIIGGELKI